jgi:hypothetical protein
MPVLSNGDCTVIVQGEARCDNGDLHWLARVEFDVSFYEELPWEKPAPIVALLRGATPILAIKERGATALTDDVEELLVEVERDIDEMNRTNFLKVCDAVESYDGPTAIAGVRLRPQTDFALEIASLQ